MSEKTINKEIIDNLEKWIDDNQEAILFANNFFGKEHPFTQFLVLQQSRINKMVFELKSVK